MALRALLAVGSDVGPLHLKGRLDGLEGLDGFGEAVWRADALARHASSAGVVATGHALLDAELPGGGWPVGALCEILQTHNAQSEWRLLLPGLCAAQGRGTDLGCNMDMDMDRGQAGKSAQSGAAAALPFSQARQAAFRGGALSKGAAWVALIGPPQVPFGPALAAFGLDVQQLLWVKVSTSAKRLWATEQALRCAGVVAVLAWLPQAQAASLRRLQMAALAHAKLLFVMRPAAAQRESSPAVLRLLLLGQSAAAPDALPIQVLKRRGPPLAHALLLPAPWQGLSTLLAACDARDTGADSARASPVAGKLALRQSKAALALCPVPCTGAPACTG